jgi:Protein of unknown function (DUF2523)
MTLTDILINAADTLPARVLASLGIGWISYESAKTLIDNYIADVLARLGEFPDAVYQILSLCGVVDAAGIVLGAFASRASFMVTKYLGAIQ